MITLRENQLSNASKRRLANINIPDVDDTGVYRRFLDVQE